MSLVLLCGGCIMLLACLVLMLMPHVELRATSAGAAARAEQDAGGSGPSAPPLDATTGVAEHTQRTPGAHAAAVPVAETEEPARPARGRHVAD
jgi:hypothetical protein